MNQTNQESKILWVEDEPEWIDLLKEELQGLPSELDTASNGDEAFKLLMDQQRNQSWYDLVILDTRVPLHAGEEIHPEFSIRMIETLHSKFALLRVGTPIVVFTVRPNFSHCVKAIRAGAVDYISKKRLPDGRTGTQLLLERCRELLNISNPVQDELEAWMREHQDLLVADYGGQVIAVLDDIASELNPTIPIKQIGNYSVCSGDGYQEVRDLILSDAALRWRDPRFINIPSSLDETH